MSDLRELYQQVIIDHSRHPHNAGKLDNANRVQQGFNPLCGDKITVYLLEEEGIVKDIKFEACGCAISVATASLMSDALRGKSIEQIEKLFAHFHDLVMGKEQGDNKVLGKLFVLGGVAQYPMRVKCATLAWHAVTAALKNQEVLESVTTE